MKDKKVALIILDGWGHGDKGKADMIHNADTPFVDSLYSEYPNAELRTDGENVGLPDGQMGNSEVGHINIGAGRIVFQELVRINNAIKDGSLAQDNVVRDAMLYAKENGKKLHLMGLVSDGGVHSHQDHLHALCDIAVEYGLEDVLVHAFTDGRDTDPKSGKGFISKLQEHIKDQPTELASVIGRYYAMDRDKRWERIKKAYDLLVGGEGTPTKDIAETIERSYENGVTDEFLEPILHVDENGEAKGTITEGDVVICFNFRTDRCRQITTALTQEDFPDYGMRPLDLYYVTMTRYDETFEGVKVIFQEQDLPNTLGETLSKAGKSQLRIAETEKYPHVSFFFSGGREKEFKGEKRVMIHSPKIATYDLKPEMSAHEVTDAVIREMKEEHPDFICLNFANPDMVGHTGVPEAIRKAVETVDESTRKVVNAGKDEGYSFIIIADHGNADKIMNEDGSPNTAHTTNPVPVFLIDKDYDQVNNGILADVAPTILRIMELPIPDEMTGAPLCPQGAEEKNEV